MTEAKSPSGTGKLNRTATNHLKVPLKVPLNEIKAKLETDKTAKQELWRKTSKEKRQK